MKDFSKKIEQLEDKLALLDRAYSALLTEHNLSEEQIEEMAEKAQAGGLPDGLQAALDQAKLEAERAGSEAASHARQDFEGPKASPRGRQGIVRI